MRFYLENHKTQITGRNTIMKNYCGETIEAGSPYTREFLVNGGEHYEWLMHNECEKVASEIWEFVYPWDGMTDDDYQEGVRNLFECFL